LNVKAAKRNLKSWFFEAQPLSAQSAERRAQKNFSLHSLILQAGATVQKSTAVPPIPAGAVTRRVNAAPAIKNARE